MGLWHRLWCHTIERGTVQERRAGVLGFKCGCGHWAAAMTRRDDNRPVITPPAHEQYRARRVGKKNIATILKMR